MKKRTTFSPFLLLILWVFACAISCRDKGLTYEEIVGDFLFRYTPLTPQEVRERVEAEAFTLGDCQESPGYELLLHDATWCSVPRGAACMRLNHLTLNVWESPRRLTFFVAVVDERSQQATVFETWFCGEGAELPPRELQRYIATGSVAGKASGEHRHKATRRLTGKVIQWPEELVIFGSDTYSACVPRGSMQTFCYPSDYYELDDRHRLYSRCEVEFSGAFVLEVIDLYSVKKVGVRLGFDALDRFEHFLYAAGGEVRGQLAAYYPFAEALPADSFPGPAPKGVRYLYRPSALTHPLRLEEVQRIAMETKAWKGAFDFPGKEKKMMEHSTLLNNRRFSLVFDNGSAWEYEIGEDFHMRFRPVGGEWKSERYDAFEADDQLMFFTHVTDGDCPIEALHYAMDLRNGLVTCLRSTFDNVRSPRDPRQEWLFGVIRAEGIPSTRARHAFTDELLGRSFTWEYSDAIASQHIYTTTESFTYAIVSATGPSVMGSFPCRYVKIRDGVYLLSWVEMRSQGIQGVLLFNTRTMHDCGACHGLTHDQTFEFNTFGAESRSAGQYLAVNP
ncbi:MAG: molybdenum cofactor biosynthesis F family protein [Tannerellaceae bacterium]|jgi:hypothetical protein|nr:molybdenum cofactor biosynthesis F family protein [Tannerellaceae bacterium]